MAWCSQVESLTCEHRCLTALVDAVRAAPDPAGAAADARALQMLSEEHVAKENGLVPPPLAMTPEVSLAALLADMHHRLANDTPAKEVYGTQGTEEGKDVRERRTGETGGCGGACG
ncbi:hypothetical protein QBA75_40335 [Streptomyces stelliscabiei]